MQSVVVLCEYTSLNGGERSFLATVEGLRAARFDLAVACPTSGPLVCTLQRKGIEHIPFTLHRRDGTRRSLNDSRMQLEQIVRKREPVLLHANSVSMSRLAGPVMQQQGVPSIGHLRDMINLSAAAIADLNRHTRLLAVSDATRDWYVARGVHAAIVMTCYNGVDLTTFQPRPVTGTLSAQLSIPEQSILIGAIGQIGLRKGLEVVLAAAARVVPQAPTVHFVIVGRRFSRKAESVDYEQQLHALAARPPLAGHVHFLGYQDDISHLLNELTIVAHAAHQEPLGRVLLEAAASGKAIIATDVGGTAEIFPQSTHAAMLVPDGDPEAFATAIRTLIESPALRHSMAAAARQRAVNMFDARAAASRIAAHYRHVRTPN